MRKLIWSNTFVRSMKRIIRKRPELRQDIENTLKLLVQDAYAPQLRTHKLKGKLSGCWACRVKYDLRVVFEFVKGEGPDDDIFLMEIGTHEEVY